MAGQYVYRNTDTGDEAGFDRPNLRLERLLSWRWQLVSAPEVEPELERDSGSGDGTVDNPPPEPQAPDRNALRTEWVEYAVVRGVPREEAEAATRTALIERLASDAAV